MELPPFPVGDEFIKKKETAPVVESKTEEEEEITHTEDTEDNDEGAEFGPSYPKYGQYKKVYAKYLISIKNPSELLEPPIPD